MDFVAEAVVGWVVAGFGYLELVVGWVAAGLGYLETLHLYTL